MERRSRQIPYAKKSFGQNFLIDADYIQKIIDSLNLSPSDTVIEIGPGRGALTQILLERAERVIAIELDRDMAAVLREQFSARENFELIEQDVLQVEFAGLVAGPTKLVANLPYYISTAVLQRLIEQRSAFSEMVLMFQREVVDRISAPPGDTDRGFLTVLTEAFLSVHRLFDVPPNAFRPIPKIWSSVVRLMPKEPGPQLTEAFVSLVSRGFAQKRKTLLNNLKPYYSNPLSTLEVAGIDPQRRAETLTLEEWVSLSKLVNPIFPESP